MDNRFLTETSAMRTLTLSTGRGDTSFKIGLSLVVLFAAAEVFFASYHYVARFRVRRSATAAQPPAATAKATPAPVATAAPPAAATAAPAATAAAPSTVALSADERLLREATELNNKGDTENALNRLQQAAEGNPKNAQVFAQMASIYESRQQLDRSNEMWRKVQEIGPSAGAVYELADARLKRGVTATPPPAPAKVAPPADVPPAPTAPTTTTSESGIPDGSNFGIAEISATETPDPDADTNLMLRIGVKKRATSVIDHTKVKIQVFFYDTVDDKDIKLTDAEVNYEWLTPDHDWAGMKPEVLAVTYVRPKNKAKSQDAALSEAAAAMNPNRRGRTAKPGPDPSEAGRRKYLGYIVRVYYNDKLQAVRADPTKLLNLFPPPSTASSP
jgi:tetratricopeptide (TPR) repeat protein